MARGTVGGRRMIPSQSVVDLLHELVAQGMDAQAFLYRAPTVASLLPLRSLVFNTPPLS